jgi:uncharacterized membrane protein YccC
MSQPLSFWVRHAALVFALRTFAAAMLAFSIALWLDMPPPYWAMSFVYITSEESLVIMATGQTSPAFRSLFGTTVGIAARW